MSFRTKVVLASVWINLPVAGGVVPIVHIPEVWALDPRIRDWDPQHHETIWMEP